MGTACPGPARRQQHATAAAPSQIAGGELKGHRPYQSRVTNLPHRSTREPDPHLAQMAQTPQDALLSLSHRNTQTTKEPKRHQVIVIVPPLLWLNK